MVNPDRCRHVATYAPTTGGRVPEASSTPLAEYPEGVLRWTIYPPLVYGMEGREEPAMCTTEYEVRGMTCAHCVSAVSTEVSKVPGVTDVKVELATGQVTVESTEPVSTEAVAAAVDEAGYELVTR